jgi:outer membrane receptor protein involved in Fe transport
VGIVIDGLDMSGVANSAALYDVEQIEFFRGPQGTRFGTSALAGSIQVMSYNPTDTFEAAFSGGYGNYDSWHGGGVVSGPITSQLTGRLAIQRLESDGYLDNEFLGRDNTNGYDETSVRGKLNWVNVAGDVNLNVTGFYFDSNNGYDAFSLDNSRETFTDNPGEDSQETAALALTSGWQIAESVLVESIVTVTHTELDYGYDEDWTYIGFCDGTLCDAGSEFSNTDHYNRERNDYSIDLRMSSDFDNGARIVAGIYAQRRDEDLTRQYYGEFKSNYDTERYAVYGQMDWPIGERWQLTTGVRFENFSDDYKDSNALDLDSDDNMWGGELTLQREVGDSTLIYATLSQGNKPGGINTEVSSVGGFVRPELMPFLLARTRFDSEKLLNREIGLKGRYLDDRLSLRVAAFHMDRDNAQLESWTWDAVNFIWVGMLDTSSDGENYGLEIEANFMVSNRVELFGSLGLLRTEIDELTVFDLDTDNFTEKSNRDQTKAPEYQFNVGANINLTDRLTARIELEGQDQSFYGYYHDGRIDSYELVNASLTYTVRQFEVRLWGRNLTDEDYSVHGLYFGNDPRKDWIPESYFQYGEPAVWGVSLGYQFR